MEKTYLIELPGTDDIGDLVSLMAQFAQADFRLITTLATHNERLAQSVASLTGQSLQTESLLTSQEGNFLPAPVARMMKVAEVVQEAPAPAEGRRGSCAICGKPAMKRSTICGRPECRRERQRRYDATWLEKKGKPGPLQGSHTSSGQTAGSAVEDEQPAAVEQPPFPTTGMMLLLDQQMQPGMMMSSQQLLKQVNAGILPAGSMFQDVSNGLYYEVRQGPAAEMSVVPAAAPGQAEKPAACANASAPGAAVRNGGKLARRGHTMCVRRNQRTLSGPAAPQCTETVAFLQKR